MVFFPISFYFYALSLLAALFVYPNTKYSYIKWFSPFLLATLVVEALGFYLSKIQEPNVFIFNFFSLIEFIFYMLIIRHIIKSRKAKKIIAGSSVVYFFISIGNILFFQGIGRFHSITYSLGCLVIVCICFYYFMELFSSPRSAKLSGDPAFWICSGLLFFYCCSFPLYAFLNFWMGFRWMWKSFTDIINILNIFLYTLFIIAFICSRTRKYISSSS